MMKEAAAASAPIHRTWFHIDQEARKFPPSAQLLLMAGIVPPNGGPDHILIKGTRPLRANFEVTRSPEARAAVQELLAREQKSEY